MALLTKDRDAQAVTASEIPLTVEEAGRAEDRSFGKAVITGSVAGIVIWAAVVFGVLRVLQPDLGAGPTLGIAAWVGLWTGLFLGGTITVGLWADKRH